MQKLLYLLLVTSLIGCDKEPTITETISVQPVQRTVLIYKGATWCGPCGSSGKPVLRAMESYGVDKVVCLSSQTSDGLNTPAGDSIGGSFMKRFNQNGIPHMFAGGNETITNFYPSQSKAENIMTTTNAASPIAGVYVNAVVNSVNGSNVEFQIDVKVTTEFFKDGFGSYTVSVLALEDDIIQGQQGSNINEHDNVIRGFGGSSPFGEQIPTTVAGSRNNFSFVIPIKSAWKKENLKVAVIIWKRNGSYYDPVNAYAVKAK